MLSLESSFNFTKYEKKYANENMQIHKNQDYSTHDHVQFRGHLYFYPVLRQKQRLLQYHITFCMCPFSL